MKDLQNIIHLEQSWGMFLGSFGQNLQHRHYAIQLSIPLNKPITIKTKKRTYSCKKSILIQTNVDHYMECEGSHLLLLINPTSAMGHFFRQITSDAISCYEHALIDKTRQKAISFTNGQITKREFTETLSNTLHQFECNCHVAEHIPDKRIARGFNYLYQHPDRLVPLEEVASHCYLSTSRFLHLFKETTGITYRRAQLWTRTRQSVPTLMNKSITETAHQFGFTDSAHYSKAFKEIFGFSPRKLKS